MPQQRWRSIIPASIKPSKYQARIFDFVECGQGDGLVNAVAGAGKTWTLIQAARIIDPAQSRIFLAFNKEIATALHKKLGDTMAARTIHSVGFEVVGKRLDDRYPDVQDLKYRGLAEDWFASNEELYGNFQKAGVLEDVIEALDKLARLTRLTLAEPDDFEALSALTARHDIALPEECLPGVAWLLEQGAALATRERVIDFTDMVWLPIRWGLDLPTFDFLFVDECQDLSPAALEFILRCRAEKGRILFVGDPAQSIYGFTGADPESFWRIKERTNATELPLSICYRCPTSHIHLANYLVPTIQARPNAPAGEIEFLPERDLAQYLGEDDLVLCRTTAPLVTWCIQLMQDGVSARMRGREIGNELVHLAERISRLPGFVWDKKDNNFAVRLGEHEAKQTEILSRQRNSAGRIQALEDKCAALRYCYMTLHPQSMGDLCQKIRELSDKGMRPAWFSTVHKAKGLENHTVFILRPQCLPLEFPTQQTWEWGQEKDLLYVGLTRARQRLVILIPDDITVDYTAVDFEEKLKDIGPIVPPMTFGL